MAVATEDRFNLLLTSSSEGGVGLLLSLTSLCPCVDFRWRHRGQKRLCDRGVYGGSVCLLACGHVLLALSLIAYRHSLPLYKLILDLTDGVSWPLSLQAAWLSSPA